MGVVGRELEGRLGCEGFLGMLDWARRRLAVLVELIESYIVQVAIWGGCMSHNEW